MSIFNSLGSNYNFRFAYKALFSFGRRQDQEDLKIFLEQKYQGQATLLYKGREAIALAMQILGLPKGSTVAVNGYTCYAVYQPIVEAGYKIDYLDIETANINFSAKTLLEKLVAGITIKVVVIQNTLGYSCDIEAIADICRQNNIVLVEDLAHSIGTIYKSGKEAGTVGDLVVLSFSQDKIIDAVSGGALIVRNSKYQNSQLPPLAKLKAKRRIIDRLYPNFTWKIRTAYVWGLGKLGHKILKSCGLLSQPMGALEKIVPHGLPPWYCKLALDQFNNLTRDIEHRKTIAKIYSQKLDKKVLLQSVVDAISHSTNLRFPVLVNDRKSLISFLKQRDVYISDIWYDAPIAPEKYLTYTDYNGQCPEAEKVSKMMLNLPTHINVSERQAEKIAEEINTWIQSQ